MSVFGSPKSQSPQASSPVNPSPQPQQIHSASSPSHQAGPATDSPTPRPRTRAATTSSSRPMSMVQTYQPPLMEIGQDVIPELQPVFSFLNSHSNKLFQEGYFLKLNDLDSRESDISKSGWRIDTETNYRWTTEHRQDMDRMLCSACWHDSVAVGCCRT